MNDADKRRSPLWKLQQTWTFDDGDQQGMPVMKAFVDVWAQKTCLRLRDAGCLFEEKFGTAGSVLRATFGEMLPELLELERQLLQHQSTESGRKGRKKSADQQAERRAEVDAALAEQHRLGNLWDPDTAGKLAERLGVSPRHVRARRQRLHGKHPVSGD